MFQRLALDDSSLHMMLGVKQGIKSHQCNLKHDKTMKKTHNYLINAENNLIKLNDLS